MSNLIRILSSGMASLGGRHAEWIREKQHDVLYIFRRSLETQIIPHRKDISVFPSDKSNSFLVLYRTLYLPKAGTCFPVYNSRGCIATTFHCRLKELSSGCPLGTSTGGLESSSLVFLFPKGRPNPINQTHLYAPSSLGAR